MTLREYIKGMTPADLESFANSCGTTAGQMKQVAYNRARRSGESLAISIERESGGRVTCEELRPDVDWAYIRGTQKPFSASASSRPLRPDTAG